MTLPAYLASTHTLLNLPGPKIMDLDYYVKCEQSVHRLFKLLKISLDHAEDFMAPEEYQLMVEELEHALEDPRG